MEEIRKRQVATQFREAAEMNFQKGDLSSAYFSYINCLKVLPELKAELKRRCLLTLNYLGQFLESKNQYTEIFIVYEEALKIYGDCEEVHHNLGAHLLRLGCPSSAAFYFKEALKLNENYFPAYRSLHSTHCALIERWHYRMLNDVARNESYRQAIAKKVLQGFDSVLDIGTGTGLFCLYALQGGAGKIYGCEYNSFMMKIANRVLNNSADRVNLLEKHSNQLTIPTDIPERVSLVVTETMDSCMLGEHLLQTLHYAWQNLLHPPPNLAFGCVQPAGAVIPQGGTLLFTFVQSRLLARKYMFPLSCVDAEDCANAFANISLKNSAAAEDVRPLSFPDLFVDLEEPYDTERLQMLADCTFLTEVQELLYVDFNSPEQIEQCLRFANCRTFEVTCTVDGYFHAIAAWFRVNVDEDLVLSSAPNDANARNCCWDQAVFPCRRAYRVVPGCKILLLSDWAEGRVTFQVQKITYPDGSTRSTDTEGELRAPSSSVSMLNDTNLLEHLRIAAVKFLKSFKGEKELRVLDTFPVPVFGLTVLRYVHLINRPLEEIQLVCVVESEDAVRVIRKMAEHNGIPLEWLTFVPEDVLNEQMSRSSRPCFDAVILNLLDKEGDLKESIIGRVCLLKLLLKDDGVMLPKKVEVCSQLVHSDYIEANMRVVNGDIMRLGIGEEINEYQVSQMVEMNLASLTFDKYSNTFTSHQFLIDDFDSEFSKEFFVNVYRNGVVNSVIYWFEVHFSEDEQSYSTLQDFSYVHQAAFLLKSPIVFHPNDTAVVQFVYHHGTFIIIVQKCTNYSF